VDRDGVLLSVQLSTADQNAENQLLELRRYVEARGWTVVDVDGGAAVARMGGRLLWRYSKALAPHVPKPPAGHLRSDEG